MALVEDVGRVLDALRALDHPHMIVGALAVDAWGVPRTTFDVDVQVALPKGPDKLRSVYLGLIVEEWSRDEVFGQDVLIGSLGTPLPIEVFVTSHWFTRQALDRRVAIRSALLRREVPVPTREDLILLKLMYHAAPGRSRRKAAQDAVDVEALVAHADKLDEPYLREAAEKLGIAPLLASFLPNEPRDG